MLISKNPDRYLPGIWPTYFKSAKGCKVKDLDNNEYIDFSTMGVGTNILGYGDPKVDNAVKKIISAGISPSDITEGSFSNYLYTSESPDPDLIIRTGGELRLSNFLLWQSAYSEYYHTKVMWPDFQEKHIDKALSSFNRRQRRFGKVLDEA